MKSRLPTITSLQRALLALSFLAMSSCALDASEDDLLADDSMSGDVASPDDEMTPDETMPDEIGTDETAADEGVAAGEEGEVFGNEATAAACVPYGRRCGSGTSCCAGLHCSFDGYIAYCRH
jgi:Ion channel inhibitory toxin